MKIRLPFLIYVAEKIWASYDGEQLKTKQTACNVLNYFYIAQVACDRACVNTWNTVEEHINYFLRSTGTLKWIYFSR